ncbi:MAG: imidazoleglycerol-phosphate dehydratase [Candidatus Omnitrophota bacterium]
MWPFGKKKEAKRKDRKTSYERKSKETQIEIPLINVDGSGKSEISTSIGFLDHMLTLFSYHGYFDINLKAKGDTHVDNHHLNEDIGLALGEAFKKALGDCKGITRTASAEVPMDKANAKVSIDLSNRPAFSLEYRHKEESIESATHSVAPNRTTIGMGIADMADEGYSMQYAKDFLESFANKLCMNLHIEVGGEGDMHHYLEAVFKALGMALDKATQIDPRRDGEVPSSKGIL